jgi:DNA-binding PadR family transcriptional regulator
MPKRKLDPLPSAAFQILLALAGEDLHGYAIMRQVAQQTEGRLRLGPGTLYSSIQTLLEAKLIEELEPREDAALGTERRRYYRLTAAGRKLARSEADRLADLLRVARAKKILRGGLCLRSSTPFCSVSFLPASANPTAKTRCSSSAIALATKLASPRASASGSISSPTSPSPSPANISTLSQSC